MALSERLAIIITANGAGAISEFKSIERSATRDLGKAETAGQKFKANWTRIGAGMVVVGAAIAAGLRTALDEASQAAVVGRQTEAVIRSTGGAANVTKSHLEDLAGSLSKVSAVDDELIQSGGNVLLTFKAVANQVGEGNDIFDRALESALDMSAALGGDLQSSALQLGKALANPLSGLTALRRAGVDFTAQQMDQIKAMVAVGDTLGAQRAIMDEVESQFDGQAEAGATALDKLSVGWGNLMETIGKPIEDSGIIDWWAANWEDPMTRLGAAWDEVERGMLGAPLKVEFDGETLSRMAEELGIGKQSLDEFGKGANDASAAVEELTAAIDDYLSGQFDLPEAQRQAGESFAALVESLNDSEASWADQGAAMQEYVTDAAAVVSVMSEQGASQQAVDDAIRSHIRSLREQRDAGKLTADEFVNLRNQILGIPRGAETRVTAPGARQATEEAAAFKAAVGMLPALKKTAIEATGVDQAHLEAMNFKRVLDTIPRTVTVQMKAVGAVLPKFASGTESAPAGLAIVGERGPEVVAFGGGERVYSNAESRAMGAGGGMGGGDIVIQLDGETIARVVDRKNRQWNMARAEA